MEACESMDIRHLKTFETVAGLLNFTRAAQALGYAQSSVTAQIKSLEEEVGQPLFERLGKRVVLTEAGRRFRPYATRIVALAHDARVAAQAADVHGVLRIGAAESLCAFRIPAVLRHYRARFPHVQLSLETGGCGWLREALRAGRVDVAFSIEETRYEDDLVVRPLVTEPIALVTYPWHRLAGAERVTPQDLEGESIIHTEAESKYRVAFDRILTEAGVAAQIAMEFTSIEPIKQTAMAGLGVTVLPRMVCSAEFEQGLLVELPWAGPPIQVVTHVIHHRDKWVSPALAAFLEMTQKILAG